MAVHIMVQEWKRQGDRSPLRYYKQVGDSNEDTSEDEGSGFNKTDFLLVLQTADQAEMMKQNPRVVAVDATHGLTGYGYMLLTILVVDKQGQGLPVGWAISSRETGKVWEVLATIGGIVVG